MNVKLFYALMDQLIVQHVQLIDKDVHLVLLNSLKMLLMPINVMLVMLLAKLVPTQPPVQLVNLGSI